MNHVDIDLTGLERSGTPTLPRANKVGTVSTDGADIWYASFGRGRTVILLHGGLQAPAKHWSSAEHHRQTRAAAAASPMMMSTMPPDTNVEALRCAMAIDFKPVWGTHRETVHLSNSIQP